MRSVYLLVQLLLLRWLPRSRSSPLTMLMALLMTLLMMLMMLLMMLMTLLMMLMMMLLMAVALLQPNCPAPSMIRSQLLLVR